MSTKQQVRSFYRVELLRNYRLFYGNERGIDEWQMWRSDEVSLDVLRVAWIRSKEMLTETQKKEVGYV